MCSAKEKVIAFYAREDDTLLTVCSYPAKTELLLRYNGNNDQREKKFKNFTVIPNQTHGPNLQWTSIYNINDNSYSLISLL